MIEDIKNHGYVADTIEPEHYVFGGGNVAEDVLQKDGHGWGAYLPEVEIQNLFGFETMGCTLFGTTNAIETIMLRKFGIKTNYSERALGVLSNMTPSGNSPHVVAEAIRKNGLIDNMYLPFTEKINTWQKYYSPVPLSTDLVSMGQRWLTQWDFKHEWVFQGGTLAQKQASIKEALKLSPLGVSVRAWVMDGDLYVKPAGSQDNHWCLLYDFVEGEYWMIFDHYDNTHKTLAWDYDFGSAKRYHIEKLLTPNLMGGNWVTDLAHRLFPCLFNNKIQIA